MTSALQTFDNKLVLKKWLKENPAEGWAWSKEWLLQRKQEKGLIYAPSQVELRTCKCPSMPYYDKAGAAEGGYYGVTASLGFTPRYANAPLGFTPLPKDALILQDTREGKPIALAHSSKEATINVGDYALAPPHDVGIRIERKSLIDFCGTLSGRPVLDSKTKKPTGQTPLKRFDAELARAQAANLYVVMMVEADINTVQGFNHLPQMKWVKASPSYLLHNLRELLVKYPLNFQCLFVDGRDEMSRQIIRVFELRTQVKSVDLQHAYERKLL